MFGGRSVGTALAVFSIVIALAHTAEAEAKSKILVLGDSLSAGYGFGAERAWPRLLARELGSQYIVTNASVSGETSAGGRARLPRLIALHRPDLLILALGANDGLRGLPLAQMRDNLRAMITAARSAGAKTLLIGMRLPPNYGSYAIAFADTFTRISSAEKVPLLPFLLDGFADDPSQFQPDGLHPVASAQQKILANVLPKIHEILK